MRVVSWWCCAWTVHLRCGVVGLLPLAPIIIRSKYLSVETFMRSMPPLQVASSPVVEFLSLRSGGIAVEHCLSWWTLFGSFLLFSPFLPEFHAGRDDTFHSLKKTRNCPNFPFTPSVAARSLPVLELTSARSLVSLYSYARAISAEVVWHVVLLRSVAPSDSREASSGGWPANLHLLSVQRDPKDPAELLLCC